MHRTALVAAAAACVAILATVATVQVRGAHEAEAHRTAQASCARDLSNIQPMPMGPERDAFIKRVVDCRLSGYISEAEWNAKVVNRN